MDFYEEVLQRMSSKSRIRALFKEVNVKDVERVLSRVKAILEEKLDQREREAHKREEVKKEIEAFKQIMQTKGLSLSDLGFEASQAQPKKTRELKKYVFQFRDNNGDVTSWSGATTGRIPRDFQQYLKKTNKKRLDCAVEEIE